MWWFVLYDICKLLLQEWSEDGLQLLPWPLEQCLSGQPSLDAPSWNPAVMLREVHGTEKPHVGTLVDSLAEPPAGGSKQHLTAPEQQPPQKQLPRQAPWEFLI